MSKAKDLLSEIRAEARNEIINELIEVLTRLQGGKKGRTTTKKAPSDPNSPGRGKKPCPKCGKYMGVRVQQCECGHTFEKKAAKSATKKK